MYTCILATKFGKVRLVSFTTVHERETYEGADMQELISFAIES